LNVDNNLRADSAFGLDGTIDLKSSDFLL